MKGFNILICCLIAWLSVTAILPLTGYNIVLVKLGLLEPFNPNNEETYLFITRSACFATMAYFGLNFLRRKRPLSSVAPMLVFTNFLVLFSFPYLLQRGNVFWFEWVAVGAIAVLSWILYRENEAETRTIFQDRW